MYNLDLAPIRKKGNLLGRQEMYTKLSSILFESVQCCSIQYLPVFYYLTYSHHVLTYHQVAPSHHLYQCLSSVKKKNNKIYMYLCSIMFRKCLKSVRYNTNLGSLTPSLYLLITVGITHNYIIYPLHLFLLYILIILLQILL